MTNTTDNLLARLKEVACHRARGLSIHIDLETWGKKPGCAIRSIGASVWNNTTGKRVPDAPLLYVNVCKKSCFNKGLTFDTDTVRWWEKQGEEAQKALETHQVSLTEALDRLRLYVTEVETLVGDNVEVWGNGKEFDISILEACYTAVHQRAPWPFWASADVRTAVRLGRMLGIDVKGNLPFTGVPHFALDDSTHQGQYTAETLHLIKQVFDVGLEMLRSPSSTQAAKDILAERQRQVTAEGRRPVDDDLLVKGELADAAGTYALHAHDKDDQPEGAPAWWPWDDSWYKPTTARRDLVKAGALILAEIERLDRAKENDDRG